MEVNDFAIMLIDDTFYIWAVIYCANNKFKKIYI